MNEQKMFTVYKWTMKELYLFNNYHQNKYFW